MSSAREQLDEAARAVAQGTSSSAFGVSVSDEAKQLAGFRAGIPGQENDLIGALTAVQLASHHFAANVAVLKTQDETLGQVLDIVR